MRSKTVDGHVVVTAGNGKLVGLKDRSVFGKRISLAKGLTKEDVVEDYEENWNDNTTNVKDETGK